jgi:hypothetical protein
MMGDGAANAAKRTLSTLSVFAGAAALAATVTVVPANSEKAPAADANQPMTIVVSLGNQKADVYRGTTLITSTSVSTGKRGYSTKAGVFSILEKRRRHYSNLYNGAPMPWMQRLTWSGTALHAGVVPGYPASHGCIRLPYSFAPKLFSMTDVGGQVVVARSRVKPQLVEHPALLQPLPLPSPPTLVKHENIQPATMRRSSNDAVPASKTRLPVMLAKAGSIEPQADQETQAAAPFAVHAETSATQRQIAVAMLEDTREHAIDPNAVPPLDNDAHAAKPTANAADKRAEAVMPDFAKQQDRLAAPADAPLVPSSRVVSLSARTVAQSAAVDATRAQESQQTEEPKAGPILTVSASALITPAVEPVSLSLAIMGLNDHPPLPPEKGDHGWSALLQCEEASYCTCAQSSAFRFRRSLGTKRLARGGGKSHTLAAARRVRAQ